MKKVIFKNNYECRLFQNPSTKYNENLSAMENQAFLSYMKYTDLLYLL